MLQNYSIFVKYANLVVIFDYFIRIPLIVYTLSPFLIYICPFWNIFRTLSFEEVIVFCGIK